MTRVDSSVEPHRHHRHIVVRRRCAAERRQFLLHRGEHLADGPRPHSRQAGGHALVPEFVALGILRFRNAVAEKHEQIARAKAGARTFLEGLPDADSARILLFSNTLRWVSDTPEGAGASRARLVSASFARTRSLWVAATARA